jgi:hypothetical protein
VAKTKTAKPKAPSKQTAVGDQEVTVCRRRGDRRQADAKPTKKAKASKAAGPAAVETATPEVAAAPAPPAPPIERRAKVQRRRQIDPTTCERDYTNDEIEFMHALDAYKRASGRMFPTCSEILEVVRGLGYQKLDSPATGEVVSTGAAARGDDDSADSFGQAT